MKHTNLIQNINKDLAIALPDEISFEELQLQLSAHINHLIKNNFEAFFFLE